MTGIDKSSVSQVFEDVAKEHFSGGYIAGKKVEMAWQALSFDQKCFLLSDRLDLDEYAREKVVSAARGDKNDFIRYLAYRSALSARSSFEGESFALILETEKNLSFLKLHQDFFELDHDSRQVVASGRSGIKLVNDQKIVEVFFSHDDAPFPLHEKYALISSLASSARRAQEEMRQRGGRWYVNHVLKDVFDIAPPTNELFENISAIHPDFRELLIRLMPAEGGSDQGWDSVLKALTPDELRRLPERWAKLGRDELFLAWLRADDSVLVTTLLSYAEKPYHEDWDAILRKLVIEGPRAPLSKEDLKEYTRFKRVWFVAMLFEEQGEKAFDRESRFHLFAAAEDEFERLSQQQKTAIRHVAPIWEYAESGGDAVFRRRFLNKDVSVNAASNLYLAYALTNSKILSADRPKKDAIGVASKIGLVLKPESSVAEVLAEIADLTTLYGIPIKIQEQRQKAIESFYFSDARTYPFDESASDQAKAVEANLLRNYRIGFWIVVGCLIIALL